MNTDKHVADIERMALEACAGLDFRDRDGDWILDPGELARFAALVRAQALDEAQQLVQANALACADGSMLQVYLASNAAAIRALASDPAP